jgi:flavin reductase (DIM6/NTAB) family NADH-FMN oxidoreductase RutF
MSHGMSEGISQDSTADGDTAPPDIDSFRRAMGRFATGVTMLTTRARDLDHAMTASALTSVSLEPILLLVCVEREARFHDAVLEAGFWGVSVLPARHRAVADWLATRGRPLHGQLERVPHHYGRQTGTALLDDALSTFECRTTAVYPAGDHSIVVGEVVAVASASQTGEALVYYRGRYGTLA